MPNPFRNHTTEALKKSIRGFAEEIEHYSEQAVNPKLSPGFRRATAGWLGGASSDLGAARKELRRRRRANRKKKKK